MYFFGSRSDEIVPDPNSFQRDGNLKHRFKGLSNRHNMQALPGIENPISF
jgi:hypothetical protein